MEALTLERVYPLRFNKLLAAVLAPFLFVAHCYTRFNEGLRPFESDNQTLNRSLRLFFMWLNYLPMLFGIILLIRLDPGWKVKAVMIVMLLAAHTVLAWQVLTTSDTSPVEEWLRTKVFASYILWGLFAIVCVALQLFGGARYDGWSIFWFTMMVGIVLLRFFLAPSVTSAALLSSLPLAGHIRKFAASPLQISTYATVAVKRLIFDPDNPTWSPLVGAPDEPYDYDYNPTTAYYPRYLALHQMPLEDICRGCLASAALPFGLVAAVPIRRDLCVDGGVADNEPLWPLIQRERCDWLLVLHHSHRAVSDEEEAKSDLKNWQRRERSYRVRSFGMPGRIYHNQESMPYRQRLEPPIHIRFRQPQFWPKIIHHYPQTDLGSILEFRRNHMEDLIARGQEAADAFLRTNPEIASILCEASRTGGST